VEDALQPANDIGQRITEAGFPNYFGPQRFGREGDTLTAGLALLTGEMSSREIPRSRRKFLLRLALSAAQSHLFNRWLGERIADGLFHQVLPGDVMQVVATGGLFLVEDQPEEQRRFDVGETVVTGPIFGPKMKSPTEAAAEREQAVMEQHNLTGDDFRRFPRLTSGTRRPSLIRPRELSIEPDPNGLRFRFTLPRGVYATSLLREFMQP
jgi:tRNA pseudouridine13 synthase